MKKLIIGIVIGLIVGSVLTLGTIKIVENTGYNKAYKELQQMVLDFNNALENNSEINNRVEELETLYNSKYGYPIVSNEKSDEYPNNVNKKDCFYNMEDNKVNIKDNNAKGYCNWTQEICDEYYEKKKELYGKIAYADENSIKKEIAKFDLKYSKQYYLTSQGGYYCLGNNSQSTE